MSRPATSETWPSWLLCLCQPSVSPFPCRCGPWCLLGRSTHEQLEHVPQLALPRPECDWPQQPTCRLLPHASPHRSPLESSLSRCRRSPHRQWWRARHSCRHHPKSSKATPSQTVGMLLIPVVAIVIHPVGCTVISVPRWTPGFIGLSIPHLLLFKALTAGPQRRENEELGGSD